MKEQRETLGSRLGFLFLSAGCAIGLGNVWRFPYIAGKFGGAAFVVMYLIFLVILGLPIMVMEFSVGRASRKSVAGSFKALQPEGTKWHIFSFFAVAGNYLLMMFYTTVAGWMLSYIFKSSTGQLDGLNPDQIGAAFTQMLESPVQMVLWMIIAIVIGFVICSFGLRNGVENTTKFLMSGLLVVMLILVVRSVTLEGASAGLAFYLKPNFSAMVENGLGQAVYAAMGQAFFTLSLGIGSMAIFGSYIEKNHSLTGESIHIMGLDTLVAFLSGLIVFPATAAFGVDAGAGPGLIFVTLPNIFNAMAGGRLWGSLFFVFMGCAAMTTVVAVFENIVAFAMDQLHWSRKKAVWINLVLIIILSLPCALGFNILSGWQPMGAGTNILDLEDFFVSNNLLPLGAMVYLLFCCYKTGWGWDNFITEADTGNGIKFPNNKAMRFYVTYIIPLIVAGIFFYGYWEKFAPLFAK
ncbi:MAG: sodium-dependent transporter [Treponemataceae bacterium]